MNKKHEKKEIRNYDILWDEADFNPTVQLKTGVLRKVLPLTKQFVQARGSIYYVNEFIELKGKWENQHDVGSILNLKLKNISESSIRITRLVFPAENGLDKFIKINDLDNISFLRNGYQSWSTSRSYLLKDRPLRPWLQLVSLASSNMANLPSNTPGFFSSDMFSIVSDIRTGNSFLVGQTDNFDQFLYIRVYFYKKLRKINYFEIIFDFGRKMIMPGETIKLDGIIMAMGNTHLIMHNYFEYLNKKMKVKIPGKNVKGWSSWYCFGNKVTPENMYDAVKIIKQKNLNINLIQLDDGYQKNIGDWLDLSKNFEGRMKDIALSVKDAGFIPGIWIAPFIADKKSDLAVNHPEYILRNEYGRALIAGLNPDWQGKFYFGLDITNPRFEEYIRKVIRTIVHKWGFLYLKLDFLFGGCLRGGTHHNLNLSRAEILKYGMNMIREEAGKDSVLSGCGMPLTPGIGTVDFMRVGSDTAPVWRRFSGSFLQTSAMIGARNSIRNFIVRSMMNKKLWINDPDCIMIRDKKTQLNEYQRMTQINAIILSGGSLIYSDNFFDLSDNNFKTIKTVDMLSDICFKGESIPVDLLDKEIPEIFYNTMGYLGIFNFKPNKITKIVNLDELTGMTGKIKKLKDVWTNDLLSVNDNYIEFKNMPAHSSRLFEIIRAD